jgi:two-component system phosphate regulon sensor histidine kinase PhoR
MLVSILAGYGGALMLAALAVSLLLGRHSDPRAAWGMLVAGVLLAGVTAFFQSAATDLASDLARLENDQIRLQERIDQQRSAVDLLADGLEVAIFICDSRGTIRFANRRAREMYSFDDPAGRSLLAVTFSYDLEQLVLDAFHEREPQQGEVTFTYPTQRTALAKAWAPDGDPRAFVSIFEITDLKRLERIRQDFVANVSHELRTPLTIIRAMAETLLDDDKPAKKDLDKYLPRIIEEVDRLSMISNDLLVLSAAESNVPHKELCDLSSNLGQVVNQLELKAKTKGLYLNLEAPDHLEIQANGSQLTQVILNLIDNALNYTSEGGVTVTLERQDDLAVLQVRDTGIGIAQEQQKRIFERFYRVDRARSRNTGGTGLGLSIVKHIVEAHGGSVELESALNAGSTFTVRLPIGGAETL